MAYSNSKLSKESGREVSHCTGEVATGADKGEVESGPGLGSLIGTDVFGLIENENRLPDLHGSGPVFGPVISLALGSAVGPTLEVEGVDFGNKSNRPSIVPSSGFIWQFLENFWALVLDSHFLTLDTTRVEVVDKIAEGSPINHLILKLIMKSMLLTTRCRSLTDP